MLHLMDTSSVDGMLMGSFGLSDMGSVDSDKYSKGVFSPSAKTEEATPRPQKVTSPQKSVSPHPVPHYQHPLAAPQSQHATIPRMSPIPQANYPHAAAHHHHMQQRKVHLGPNFDRLGILNQANEIPPLSTTPYFAKALQQHSNGTLGAILQAHQHALQQQMQRESFLLQQAVHQQMLQGVPFNMYHHQRLGGMMLDRRADDQIVPNQQMVTAPENWMKHHSHPSPRKRAKRKHDDSDTNERRKNNNYKEASEMHEKYVIFNDENQTNQMSEDECSSPRIAPPKDSVFVRYPANSCKTLPSFSDAFTGHLEKLKMKEQHLKDSLMRHGVSEPMITEIYPTAHSQTNDNMSQRLLTADDVNQQQLLTGPCTQGLPETDENQQIQTTLDENLDPLAGIVDQLLPDGDLPQSILSDSEISKIDNNDTSLTDSLKEDQEIVESIETENKLPIDNKDVVATESEKEGDAITIADEDNVEKETNQLDYLNDITNNIAETAAIPQKEKDSSGDGETKKDETKNSEKVETKPVEALLPADSDALETQNATNNINIFEEDLDLDTDNRNYDNLFNGNSDEHYFQAFKENNLHLIGDLNETKMDGNDDILKLLHSPLDFLNDKFLR